MAYINHLVEKGDYDSAARYAPLSLSLPSPSLPLALSLPHIWVTRHIFVFASCRKCQKVLGKNMELWENEVYRFKTIGQLKVRKEEGERPLAPSIARASGTFG